MPTPSPSPLFHPARRARGAALALLLAMCTLGASGSSGSGGSTSTSSGAVAEWRFEESAYVDTNDEVVDSSGNARHGRARNGASTANTTPANASNPGTCRYVSFSSSRQGIEVPAMKNYSATSALTYVLWMYPKSSSGTPHVMGPKPNGSSYSQLNVSLSNGNLIARAATSAGTYSVTTTAPTSNQWTHVAVTFSSTGLVLYKGGQAVASTTFSSTSLVSTQQDFMLSNQDSGVATYSGYLDEVRVYGSTLSAATIASVMAETRACSGTTSTRPKVVHDQQATWCQAESIQVQIVDATGNRVTTATSSIMLDTQTGSGTWSLASGSGTFSDGTASDGLATYAFVSGDSGQATFWLTYSSGASSIDVDAYDTSTRDDDSEGMLAFSPAGLLLTAHAIPNPAPTTISDPLGRQTAGSTFDVYLASSGGSGCQVASGYTGSKSIKFWVQYVNPSSGTIAPTVGTASIAASEAAATSQSVSFSSGRGSVSVEYKDAGQIVIWAADASNASIVRGSTGNFVSAPADLRVVAVANASGTANPGTSDPTGSLFARAGEAFSVTVDALDADGDRTPNFGRESSPEGIRIVSSTLVAPSGGRNGTTSDGTLANADAFAAVAGTSGRFTNTTVAFDEVGAIKLRASVDDGSYLGSGAVTGTESSTVGRFAPYAFSVSANTPRFATACAIGAFTWMGQPFGYVSGSETQLTVTATNRAGTITRNYAGTWFRLANSTLAHRAYSVGGASGVAVDESGLPAASADPAITSNGDGTALLAFSTGSGLVLSRTTAVAPFDAELSLALEIADADATVYAGNPYRVGATTTGNGIAFSDGKRFQFGRLRLENAFGSELASLPMRLRTQRFDGTAYDDDDADSCSRVTAAHLVLTPSASELVTSASVANVPLLSGNAGLAFGAPSVSGYVDVRVNLGTTGANLPWLRADWPDDGNLDGALDDDPQARATFGIWEGRESLIFQREYY